MNKIIQDGLESKILKENEIFATCLEEVRSDLYQKWCQSNFSDATNREELYKTMVAIELIVARLDSKIFMAESQISENEDILQ